MANLLVMMEFYRGAFLPVSLEVLGQARRLGSELGMTVYALVPLPPEPAEDEDITVRCGRFGADKVLLLTGDALFAEHEMRFEYYSDALVAACTMLPPRLFMMGETPAARDIIPRLAARLGAAYLARGAALAVEHRLILCDPLGRHLRIPLEAASSEGIPPLTVPVMMTVPPGRHEMAWGDQDAELMIVPAQDDSAQTIPNLTVSRTVRGGFTEEAIEPIPLTQKVVYRGGAAGSAGSMDPQRKDADGASPSAVPPLWQICAGSVGESKDLAIPPWRVSISASVEPAANYQLIMPESEIAATVKTLQELLRVEVPVAPITQPGPQIPTVKAFEGFDDSNEFTPTGEPWDYSGDTLNGDEETTSRIRQVLAENQQGAGAVPASSAATPPVRIVESPRPPLHGTPIAISVPVSSKQGAAMWEGFATLPDEDELPVDEDGNPRYDVAHADTAPVSVVAPGIGKPKEGA